MSVAYSLVCEPPLCEVAAVEVKALAEHTEQVNDLLELADLKLIDNYVIDDYSGLSALAEELHVNFLDTSGDDEQWFDAAEGLQWLEKLQQIIVAESDLATNEVLLADIVQLKQSLQQAMTRGIQWRLQVNLDA